MAKTAIQQIISALAKQYNLSAAEAAAFVDAFFDIVSSELKNGNQVKIKGLGTFKVQSVKPRESVNVNTGERVLIEGHDKISFTPDAVMKELVNKPFSQFETVVINDGVDTEELERVPVEESSDEVKSEIVNDFTPEKTLDQEKTTVVKEEKIEVEVTKEDVIENSSAKASAVDVDDSLIENSLPIDVIEEPSSNVEEILETEEKTSVLEEYNKEVEKVIVETESKVEPTVESEVETVTDVKADTKVEEDTIEVDVKPVQAVSNVLEKQEEPLREENIEKIELSKTSESTNISEDENNDVEGSENGLLKKVALIAFIIIICLGIFLWARMGSSNSRKNTKEVAEQVNNSDNHTSLGTKTVSADTTATKVHKAPKKKETAKVDSFMALNSDPRIRYGAYNIIGIDRIVVLKKGETMEKYSRKTLGADMVGYFQVLNGRKTMQAGDTMKVPKVELRPEYRK
ncbi:HU family DNA-binding protein [Prevotella melaninogenica]|uniref:Integration host factor n=1 Tax=Prevotella melaninogenica TaxID=28132 RepID=A0A250KL74_9BACT|nr:HU family DNA-binding protein [Prevotella melaninogenica]BBA30420.1 integration host factor [Prevotella melaninogenica]